MNRPPTFHHRRENKVNYTGKKCKRVIRSQVVSFVHKLNKCKSYCPGEEKIFDLLTLNAWLLVTEKTQLLMHRSS